MAKWKRKLGYERAKYNWAALKLEYMEAPELEVAAFFRRKFGEVNRHQAKYALGWAPEKKERLKRVANKAIIKSEDKEAADLLRALQNVRTYFKLKVNSLEELNRLTVRDAKRIWEILRTENSLPCRITKNENTNINKDETEAFDKLESYEGRNKNKDFTKNQNSI